MDALVSSYLIDEGGVAVVHEVCVSHADEVPVLAAAFDALYNLGNDSASADSIVEVGLLDFALEAIVRFDYERELVHVAVRFLSALSFYPTALGRAGQLSAAVTLLDALTLDEDGFGHAAGGAGGGLRAGDGRIDPDAAFVDDAVTTFSNLCTQAASRAQLRDAGGVGALLATLEAFAADDRVPRSVLMALTRLAIDDGASHDVAHDGMHTLMSMLKRNVEDPLYLSLMFELLAQIGFVKTNLKPVVQYGGIKVISRMMDLYRDDADLMLKATQCLDNLVSGEPENAELLAECGGLERLAAVREEHAGDDDLAGAVKSCLLSVEVMRRLREEDGAKTNRAFLYARLGGSAVKLGAEAHRGEVLNVQELSEEDAAFLGSADDPLSAAGVRNLLLAGVSCKEYVAASAKPVSRHVYIARDWHYLVVKEAGKSDKLRRSHRVHLRNVRRVRAGHGAGHGHKGLLGGVRIAAAAEHSFVVETFGDRRAKEEVGGEFCFECMSRDARDAWLSAMEKLVLTQQRAPEKLLPALS